MSTAKNDVRINIRLSSELKRTIEEAAAELGESVNAFAVSTLVLTARKILHDQQITRLSDRDGRLFAEMMDDKKSKPTDALARAAKRYKKQVG